MKKFLVLILTMLYITTSNGMVFSKHWCMGKERTKCLCKKSAKKEKGSCCQDEVKILKVDQLHKASVVDTNIKVPEAVVSSFISIANLYLLPAVSIKEPVAHGPPILETNNIYILNCVFRI